VSHDASQEAEVEVRAVVTRLAPCLGHEFAATGEHVFERGICVQNPNGYRHDCPDCAATTTKQEEVT